MVCNILRILRNNYISLLPKSKIPLEQVKLYKYILLASRNRKNLGHNATAIEKAVNIDTD